MTELKKKLTLYGLTMIAVGACIGSGIFVTPAEIVKAVPSHSLVILVWALGGIVALTGALTFAELGSMFPKSGGVYVYLKEAYGDIYGFFYGWVILLVINTGALAALSVAFTEYMTFFYPFSDTGKLILGVCTILGLTALNMTGVSVSQHLSNTFTGLKLLAIFGIILVGFLMHDSSQVTLDFGFETQPDNLLSALLVALIGVLWSMGGWHHASYLSGETIDAKKTVPRAMILGVLIVTVTYIFVNLAYMMLLPLDEIAATERVAGDAVQTVVRNGGKLVSIAIAISIFGTISIYTMSAPRIYFAMAKDGVFFKGLTHIHPRFGTPIYAMAIQAIWAVILILFWQKFHDLISYVVFMDILFMALAGFSIFVFRRNRKDAERPIKALGYPIIPLIFVLISIAFVGSTLIQQPNQAWAGLVVLLLGFPVYYFFKKRNAN